MSLQSPVRDRAGSSAMTGFTPLALWEKLLQWLLDARRATYGLAIMRIGFGAMTLVILALYLPNYSYSFGEGSRWGEAFYRTSSANDFLWPITALFSRTDSDLIAGLKAAVVAAAAVAYMLGWRMRIISPLFVVLWLGYVSTNPMILNTGHYQTFRVMIIFLLLADTSYRWSLDARRRRLRGDPLALGFRDIRVPRWVPVLSNNVAVILVGAQLCIIYLTSAAWKLQGDMWHDGSAVYYTLRLEELALFPWLNGWMWTLTPVVMVASWVSIYGQLLFPILLVNRWTRIAGLIMITGMHAGIGVLLALPWFSLMMILADMIFIRDRTWRRVAEHVRPRIERIVERAPRPSSRRSVREAQPTQDDETAQDVEKVQQPS